MSDIEQDVAKALEAVANGERPAPIVPAAETDHARREQEAFVAEMDTKASALALAKGISYEDAWKQLTA